MAVLMKGDCLPCVAVKRSLLGKPQPGAAKLKIDVVPSSFFASGNFLVHHECLPSLRLKIKVTSYLTICALSNTRNKKKG